MGGITFRLLLAHLLPGFLPTLLFFAVLKKDIQVNVFGKGTDIFTLYVLASISMGIVVDLLKRKFMGPFMRWANLRWIGYFTRKLYYCIRRNRREVISLREAFRRYEEKLAEAVRLWLALRIGANRKIQVAIKDSHILTKEFMHPTITSGDWWALLSIREQSSLRFFLEEYFSYYEFSSNFFVSLLITEGLAVFFRFSGDLSPYAFSWISIAFGVAAILFHELTIFWMLATRRFVRKVLLYSILENHADG